MTRFGASSFGLGACVLASAVYLALALKDRGGTAAGPAGRAVAGFHGNGGRIALVEDVLDFGRRYDDETVTMELRARNVGSGPLTLQTIKSGCGCATAAVPTEAIPERGEAAPIRVEIRLSGMSGPFERVGFVLSDDATCPRAPFTILGDVRRRYEIEPSVVELKGARPGDGAGETVRVRRLDGEPAGAITMESDTPGIEIVRRPEGPDPAIAEFDVRIAEITAAARGSIRIALAREQRFVGLVVQPGRDVWAEPASLAMGLVSTGEPATVRLVGRDGVDWSIRSIRTSRSDLDALPTAGGLEIRWNVSDAEGILTGDVLLELEGAQPASLRIPVTALLRKRGADGNGEQIGDATSGGGSRGGARPRAGARDAGGASRRR